MKTSFQPDRLVERHAEGRSNPICRALSLAVPEPLVPRREHHCRRSAGRDSTRTRAAVERAEGSKPRADSAPAGASSRRGSTSENLGCGPDDDSTSRPPSASARRRASARPMPRPSNAGRPSASAACRRTKMRSVSPVMPGPSSLTSIVRRAMRSTGAHRYGACAVAARVVEQRIEHLRDRGARSAHDRRSVFDGDAQCPAVTLEHVAPVTLDLPKNDGRIDGGAIVMGVTGEREELRDGSVEPVDFRDRLAEKRRVGDRAEFRSLERQAQSRQGSPQLMRRIHAEGTFSLERVAETNGGRVERTSYGVDLGDAARHVAYREIAVAQARGSSREPDQRSCQSSRLPVREPGGDAEHGQREQTKERPGLEYLAIDVTPRFCRSSDPDDLCARDDRRHGGRPASLLPSNVAVAGTLQRRLELRRTGAGNAPPAHVVDADPHLGFDGKKIETGRSGEVRRRHPHCLTGRGTLKLQHLLLLRAAPQRKRERDAEDRDCHDRDADDRGEPRGGSRHVESMSDVPQRRDSHR